MISESHLHPFSAKTRFAGRVGSPCRVSGLRFFAASTEEYSKRNYANNVSEYNTVVGSLSAQRRSLSLSLFTFFKKIYFFLLIKVYTPFFIFFLEIINFLFLGFVGLFGRNFLLRDVYDDMMLDGVKPNRDIFHSLVVGTMRGSRMQDAFFFMDQMKIMGMLPDVCTIFSSP